jgi:hypothetical protein
MDPPTLVRQNNLGVDWSWVKREAAAGNPKILEFCRRRRQRLSKQQRSARRQLHQQCRNSPQKYW